MYRIFTRTWWVHNDDFPNGLEPCPGKKRTIAHASTLKRAREICADYNRTTAVSTKYNRELGMKAEFEKGGE